MKISRSVYRFFLLWNLFFFYGLFQQIAKTISRNLSRKYKRIRNIVAFVANESHTKYESDICEWRNMTKMRYIDDASLNPVFQHISGMPTLTELSDGMSHDFISQSVVYNCRQFCFVSFCFFILHFGFVIQMGNAGAHWTQSSQYDFPTEMNLKCTKHFWNILIKDRVCSLTFQWHVKDELLPQSNRNATEQCKRKTWMIFFAIKFKNYARENKILLMWSRW